MTIAPEDKFTIIQVERENQYGYTSIISMNEFLMIESTNY